MYQPYPSRYEPPRPHEPPQYELSRDQRNSLFSAIEASGIPVTDFELSSYLVKYRDRLEGVRVRYHITAIRHPATGSIFGIQPEWDGRFAVQQHVSGNKSMKDLFKDEKIPVQPLADWWHVPGCVESWAREIRQWIKETENYARTPDLWEFPYRSGDYTPKYETSFEYASSDAEYERNDENGSFTQMQPFGLPSTASPAPSVTVNFNQQVISAAEGAIVQNFQGTTNFGVQANELLDLVRRFGGQEAVALQSSVYELENPDTRPANRLQAKRRLKSFLLQLGGKIEDAALTALTKYLETKIGI
jgi:hypothetical protein